MQSAFCKIPVLAAILVAVALYAPAQTSSYRLKTADSLFTQNRFTESYEQYEAILANGEYTPAMLLRMGYIQEGLGRVGRALYFLSLYYNETADPGARRKMEELAQKHNLVGYETTDVTRFLGWYREAYDYISLALAAIAIFCLALALRTRFRKKQRPIGAAIMLVVFIGALFVHLNYGINSYPGIIASSNAYIMTGPSAASDVVEYVGEGHRLQVLGKRDVWLKVVWDGKEAFIKNDAVLEVGLGTGS